jgi:hypothetical protein
MAFVAAAIAVPRPPEQTISLYLGLRPGERVDLAVLGRAMAAYAEAIKEISYTFEPGIEFKIDFDGSETGSVKLRTLLRAATSRKAITSSLISIAVTVGVAFGRHVPGDLRTYGVGKLIDAYVLPSQKQELSDNDVERIAKKVVEVQEGRLAKPQIEAVYREIERDRAIDSVGTITKPDEKLPPAPVPREEFAGRAGIVQAIETTPKTREKITIERLTLIRPVLAMTPDRVWRFSSPMGEESYTLEPDVLKDLLSGKRHIELKVGVDITFKIRTIEIQEGGVWKVKERQIIDLVRIHRKSKSDLFTQPKKKKPSAKKKRKAK